MRCTPGLPARSGDPTLAPMSILARWVPVAALCLFLACSDDSGNGDGGAAGTGAGAAGRGGSGGAGRGGSGGGAAGSGGAPVSTCQTCLACVMSTCSAAIATCQANTGCNAIYECARTCTTDANACVTQNPSGLVAWATSVSTCLNQGCQQPCSYLMP